jgi:hypothetical protein
MPFFAKHEGGMGGEDECPQEMKFVHLTVNCAELYLIMEYLPTHSGPSVCCGGGHVGQVADIKRMNSLTTDLQMFALKTLRIPLPSRHSPSATHTSSTSSLTR